MKAIVAAPVDSPPLPTMAAAAPTDVLNHAQKVRIECLRAAREVLVTKGFASSGRAFPSELITIARFIEGSEK